MAPMARWGDDADSDSDDEQMSGGLSAISNKGLTIPPTHKSRIDSKGIQIITSYKHNPSKTKLIKIVTKVKVTKLSVKEPIAVGERRAWKVFGQAAIDKEAGTVTNVQSKEEIILEDPNADTDLQDEDPSQAISGNLNAFWAKQKQRQLERKYDVGGPEGGADGAGAPGASVGGGAGGADGGWTTVGSGGGAAAGGGPGGAGAGGGKYVPPSQRGLGGAAAAAGSGFAPQRRTDDLNTIRVTNLSENTTEADLQDLFQRFGRISRVYLAKDKETLQSRGFAFVSFVSKEDAAKAMEELQGFGYDHLILKLEWARPNAPKDPSAATEFRSGYGKALAQDTKEKVSYASNLTKGTR